MCFRKSKLVDAFAVFAGIILALPAGAVTFLETGDPAHNTSTPGDNSGWQYEGKFIYFLGVPIAPYFFITAKHFEGSVGEIFDFHGSLYTTIAKHPSPNSDLQIWEVDHDKPFLTFAPLASSTADTGTVATIIGRGTQRGDEVRVGGELKGWNWGLGDGVQRWGRNLMEGSLNGVSDAGIQIYANFNSAGVPDECHLSVGDSGGGVFVLENGLWRLAGINYAVEGPFRFPPAGAEFYATLFDERGLQVEESPDNWGAVVEGPEEVPSGFLSTRVSQYMTWVRGVTGDSGVLPTETFDAWQTLYFSPSQIADSSVSGPLADPDGDGVANLLEFALNLDPTFAEPAAMTPDTGLRGLPTVRVETISGVDRLTIEFVRRTAASDSGLTYQPEFSSDLTTWSSGVTTTVTTINSRWERVKMQDPSVPVDGRRFARLRVTRE
jgi:hypothetical protein